MKKLIILFAFVSGLASGQSIYQKDFSEFWTIINDNYAYFEKQKINWEQVKKIFEPATDTIKNNDDFIRLLEMVLNELYNGHCSLNTNLQSSNRIIPTGLDIYVEIIDKKFIITDLRKDMGAEKCGLQTGMEVVLFNGRKIDEQLFQFLPKFTHEYTSGMYQYSVSMLFAGKHNQPRKITCLENGKLKDYFPDSFQLNENRELAEYKILENNTGYLKINNSLGDYDLIPVIDGFVDKLLSTKAMIIDLTETPSGGNSTIAKAIMGRFIDKKLPYQQHEFYEVKYDTKSSWVEYVSPRKTVYSRKVVIMEGHWTGSMGEGIVIGFDAMNRATIVGTEMAGLLGAINQFTLTETKIGFQIPTERLYHINGMPREDYKPELLTKNTAETWDRVMKILNTK